MARKIPGKSLQQIITSITIDIFVCYYYYMFTRVAEGPEIYFFFVWKVIEFVQKFGFSLDCP